MATACCSGRNFRALLTLFPALTSFLASPHAAFAMAKEVKIHGYITELDSPTHFQIDNYRISREANLSLEFEKDQNEPKSPVAFLPTDLRVGTEIEVKGLLEDTGALKATSIKVHLTGQKVIHGTALLEQSPSLTRSGESWSGEILADGQRIVVQPATKVRILPNGLEKKAQKVATRQHPQSEAPIDMSVEGVQLETAGLLGPDTWVDFRGVRQPDGRIVADSVQFKRNELERGEARLRQGQSPKIKPLKNDGGELIVRGMPKYRLFPDKELQSYVTEIGTKLIPEFQRSMSAGNPDKIDFRFFVVDSKALNAFALANGSVLVTSGMIRTLKNEAQLASVLGHEISHAVGEHAYRQMQYHKWSLLALEVAGAVAASRGKYNASDAAKLIEAAIRNGYSRSLEDQADRLGLKYMVDAGYDARQAPQVWKVLTLAQGDPRTNFFWSDHNSNTVRRSYLMAELKNNYAEVDYSLLRTGDERYANILLTVSSRSAQLKKIRVH